jgi:hypothetical protein
MLVLLFGVGAALLIIGIASEFFRVMSWIVSIVSPPVILGFQIKLRLCPQYSCK